MKTSNLQEQHCQQYFKKMTSTSIEEKVEKHLIANIANPIKSKEKILKDSMKILLDDIEKRITINDLCKEIGTNPSTISKIFNDYLNQSPFAWLKKERLELSAKSLIKTDYKIYKVAYEVGYSDPNNFSTAFKKYFGVSPDITRKDSVRLQDF